MGLSLLNAQTNDSKILYLTDTSTWNDGDLPVYTDITSAILQIQYQTPDLDDFTTIVEVDVISIFTGASTVDDLIFPIVFGSEPALGTTGINPLPDGIWKIQYIVGNGVDAWSFDSALELLLDMTIKTEIYSQLASVPLKYLCANNYYTKPIDDVLLLKSLHYSMEANAYVAKQEEILNTLDVLQRQTE